MNVIFKSPIKHSGVIAPIVRRVYCNRHKRHSVALGGGYKTAAAALCKAGLNSDSTVIFPQKSVVIDKQTPSLITVKGNDSFSGRYDIAEFLIFQSKRSKTY